MWVKQYKCDLCRTMGCLAKYKYELDRQRGIVTYHMCGTHDHSKRSKTVQGMTPPQKRFVDNLLSGFSRPLRVHLLLKEAITQVEENNRVSDLAPLPHIKQIQDYSRNHGGTLRSKAFNHLFDTIVQLMCWSHFMRAFEKNIKTKVTTSDDEEKKKVIKELKEDVRALHYIPYPFVAAFEYAAKVLFPRKWNDRGESSVASYFLNTWVGRCIQWGRAYIFPGFASTNNGLERGNRTIKDLQEHKRLPLGEYMLQLLRVLSHHLSLQAEVAHATPIYEDDWWVVQKYDRVVKKGGDLRVEGMLTEIEGSVPGAVLVPSGESIRAWKRVADGEAADDKDAKEIMEREQTKSASEFVRVWGAAAAGEQALRDLTPALTFDGLIQVLSTFHVCQPLPTTEPEPFIRFSCSCRHYQDRGKCKHVMREGLREKLFAVPEDMQLGVIGREKTAGRKKKTTKAGVLQPGEEATLGGHVAEPEADREPEAVADPADPEVEEADPEDPWVEYCKDE